ncbi:MAG TPA: PAS domain S-box protein [Candidatus Cloacimonetes bacterium]|nr:PAS domain S-box protein [Candidatus Cloacimonadota bacterium]
MREYELMKLLDKALFGYAQIRLLPGDKSEVQDMVIETANKKFCEMFDTDQDTLIGSKKSRLKGAIADAADELMSQINTGAEDRLDYPFDIHVQDTDKWLLTQIISMDDDIYNIFFLDKTKYIETSHILKSHEKLNQAIIEQSSEWTMLFDEDYQVLRASPRGSQITGLSMDELAIFDPAAHIHPDDYEVFTSFLQDLKDNPAKLQHIKTRFINSENNYIWLEITGSNFVGFPGLNGYLLQSKDITEHMEAKQKVNHQNEYIKSLLNAIPDLIAVIQKDGTVLDIRSGSNLRMHLDPKDVLGKNITDILGEPFNEIYLKTIQKALKDGKTHKTQYEVNYKGIDYHYGVRLSPLGKDRVLALERDVSDLFESQMLVDKHTKFQSLIAEISTAFVKADGDAIDQVLDMSLAKIGEFFEVHRAFIIDYNLDYSWTSLHSSWHAEGDIGMVANAVNKAITPKSWPHNLILNNQIVHIDDLSNLPDMLKEYIPDIDMKEKLSLMMLPVQSSDKVVAILCFSALGTVREFSHDEINNLKLVANMLGEMINKQKINRRLKEEIELQEIINTLALKYINLPVADLDDAIDVSLIKLAQYTETDQVMICTYDWDRNLLTVTAEWFKDEEYAKKRQSSFRYISEFPQIAELHKKGEIFMFESIGKEAVGSIGMQSVAKYGVKSVIFCPLLLCLCLQT